MPIKAIIIDDERLARNELKKLLEQHPEIEIIDEASNVDEAMVIHAGDFTKEPVKRGDYIYLSCLMKKPGTSYSPQQQGVLQCRVTDIYLGLTKLNSLMK